jgi:hypothetical protein
MPPGHVLHLSEEADVTISGTDVKVGVTKKETIMWDPSWRKYPFYGNPIQEYDQSREDRMRNWGFWDWLAYACLLVGAMILAADTGLKIAPDLAGRLPSWFLNPLWGFAPLALIIFGTITLLLNSLGIFRAVFGPRHPINFFLERDSSSDLRGIQTFPAINYIQISATASRKIEQCRALITRVEYDVGGGNYAIEFSERVPIPWSKTGGDDFEVLLEPGHPPIRMNVAIFDRQKLGFDRATPTNLFPLLQRIGVHRFTIFTTGVRANGTRINETLILEIDWRGPGNGAYVKQLKGQ